MGWELSKKGSASNSLLLMNYQRWRQLGRGFYHIIPYLRDLIPNLLTQTTDCFWWIHGCIFNPCNKHREKQNCEPQFTCGRTQTTFPPGLKVEHLSWVQTVCLHEVGTVSLQTVPQWALGPTGLNVLWLLQVLSLTHMRARAHLFGGGDGEQQKNQLQRNHVDSERSRSTEETAAKQTQNPTRFRDGVHSVMHPTLIRHGKRAWELSHGQVL